MPKTRKTSTSLQQPTNLQDAIDRVLEPFWEFIPIMTTEAASTLPKHTVYDHAIDFKEGTTPPWGPMYGLKETGLEELRWWLKKNGRYGGRQTIQIFVLLSNAV